MKHIIGIDFGTSTSMIKTAVRDGKSDTLETKPVTFTQNGYSSVPTLIQKKGDAVWYVVQRLHREKRCGTVTELGGGNWRFEADVFDAVELLPWIRTFTGRIVSLKSTDPEVEKRFYGDLVAMRAMYGGNTDAVQ